MQEWSQTAGHTLSLQAGRIQGHTIEYVVLLDEAGEPRQDGIREFLVWYASQENLQQAGVKFAQKYIMACMQMERHRRGLELLEEGTANRFMEVRVAAQQSRRTHGESSIAACSDLSTRADHLPTFEEMTEMMHLCFAGDARIHRNPLAALQTGGEVRITHTTGVRGQLVRSAKFEHVWPRFYPPGPEGLACGRGMRSTVMYNVRGDKTHLPGDGSHTGWVMSRNALFCPSGILGLCLLYRFCVRGERFPSVCDCNGREYKWLPLIINTEMTFELDTDRALLPVRGVCPRTQNACFNQLFAAAGVEMYSGDPVTHAGRAAAQQEFENAGGDSRISNEALGYQVKDAKKDHYTPQVPLSFQLQRGGFPFATEHLGEADAAQLRVLHERAPLVREIVDLALPELTQQEAIVSTIQSQPASMERADVMAQKRINSESHKREHEHFLGLVRDAVSKSLVDAASRPCLQNGRIAYEQQSLIERHGGAAIYKSIRIRSTDEWLYDHPKFIELKQAVREAEEVEKNAVFASPSREKTAKVAAAAVTATLGPTLSRIEDKLGSSEAASSTALATAASAAQAVTSVGQAATAALQGVTAHDAQRVDDFREGLVPLSSLNEAQRHLQYTAPIPGIRALSSYAGLIKEPPATSQAQNLAAPGFEPDGQSIARDPPPASAPAGKRQRRADGPGLNHSDFPGFGGRIDQLWGEYVGSDGNQGLRRREAENPNWKTGNKPSRDLFNDKCFYYREIARQANELGSIEAALIATQARLDEHKSARSPGWSAFLKLLQSEQPVGIVRDDLNRKLDEMQTSD